MSHTHNTNDEIFKGLMYCKNVLVSSICVAKHVADVRAIKRHLHISYEFWDSCVDTQGTVREDYSANGDAWNYVRFARLEYAIGLPVHRLSFLQQFFSCFCFCTATSRPSAQRCVSME